MTDTIGPVPARIDQQQLAQELVEAARADGVELVGPGGLLTGLTKTVLETALEAEMTEHPRRPPRGGAARAGLRPSRPPATRRRTERSRRGRAARGRHRLLARRPHRTLSDPRLAPPEFAPEVHRDEQGRAVFPAFLLRAHRPA